MKVSWFSIRNISSGQHLICLIVDDKMKHVEILTTQNVDEMFTPTTYEKAEAQMRSLGLKDSEWKIVRWTMEDYR